MSVQYTLLSMSVSVSRCLLSSLFPTLSFLSLILVVRFETYLKEIKRGQKSKMTISKFFCCFDEVVIH